MELKKLKRTQITIVEGYYFDGTLECAKQIFENIRNIDKRYVNGFNLKYNFYDNSLIFDYGGYGIGIGDMVAISNESNMSVHEVIQIYSKEDILRWGYEVFND